MNRETAPARQPVNSALISETDNLLRDCQAEPGDGYVPVRGNFLRVMDGNETTLAGIKIKKFKPRDHDPLLINQVLETGDRQSVTHQLDLMSEFGIITQRMFPISYEDNTQDYKDLYAILANKQIPYSATGRRFVVEVQKVCHAELINSKLVRLGDYAYRLTIEHGADKPELSKNKVIADYAYTGKKIFELYQRVTNTSRAIIPESVALLSSIRQ